MDGGWQMADGRRVISTLSAICHLPSAIRHLFRDRAVSHVRAAHERSAFDVMKAEGAGGGA
jgi:hypothetical protein